jgi:hypothetical protein
MHVRAQAVGWVDDSQPGWVEVDLTDRHGTVWTFRDKVPVVTTEILLPDTDYPVPIEMDCAVREWRSDSGRRYALVELLWDVGPADQLYEIADDQLTG